MSLRIIDAAIETERADQIHEARLLLLLRHAAKRKHGSVTPGPDATGEATAIFMLAKTVVSR